MLLFFSFALLLVCADSQLQFAPSPLVVAGSAVVVANQGDIISGVSVPTAPFDGMGIMLDPTNSSQVHVIINTEANPSVVFRLTLQRQFPFSPVATTTLFSNGYNRLCSGNVATPSALFFNGLGTSRPVYLSGEESINARAYAFFVDEPNSGDHVITSYGRLQFENIMPCPYGQTKTITCLTDDFSPLGYVVFHVGTKTNVGTDFVRSGLNGGQAYGLQMGGWTEGSTDPSGTRFSLVALADLTLHASRADTAAELMTKGATAFARPEDSEWARGITTLQQVLYFATTGSASGPSRLWKLTFDDISQPELGGTFQVMARSTTVPFYDNVAVSEDGAHLYAVTDAATLQFIHRFSTSGSGIQQFELIGEQGSSTAEFTGIISAPQLGGNYFLCNRQGASQLFAFQVVQCLSVACIHQVYNRKEKRKGMYLVIFIQPPICHPKLGWCQFRSLVSPIYDCPEPQLRCNFVEGVEKKDETSAGLQVVFRRAMIPVIDSLSLSVPIGTDMIIPTGLAASFTSPAALSLLSRVLVQITCPASVNLGATIEVTLQSSIAGPAPSGTVLYSIGSIPEQPASTIITLPASFLLTPNTRYWIVLSSSNGALCGWSYTSNLSGLGVSSEFNRPASGTVVANTVAASMMTVVVDTDVGSE